MGASVIGRVVQKGITALHSRVILLHGLRHEIGTRKDVNGYRLRRGQQLMPAAQDATGTVVAARDDAGARRAHERMLHGPGYGVETPGEYRESERIHFVQRVVRAVGRVGNSRGNRPVFGNACRTDGDRVLMRWAIARPAESASAIKWSQEICSVFTRERTWRRRGGHSHWHGLYSGGCIARPISLVFSSHARCFADRSHTRVLK